MNFKTMSRSDVLAVIEQYVALAFKEPATANLFTTGSDSHAMAECAKRIVANETKRQQYEELKQEHNARIVRLTKYCDEMKANRPNEYQELINAESAMYKSFCEHMGYTKK